MYLAQQLLWKVEDSRHIITTVLIDRDKDSFPSQDAYQSRQFLHESGQEIFIVVKYKADEYPIIVVVEHGVYLQEAGCVEMARWCLIGCSESRYFSDFIAW